MKCRSCGINVNVIKGRHCWEKSRQCGECHYFRRFRKTKEKKRGRFPYTNDIPAGIQRLYMRKITPENINLYCKLSYIIRGKKCINKNLLLKSQHAHVINIP